jgi:zinc and cadmium transporter
MNTINLLLFYALVGGLFSLIGGLALLLKPTLTNRFLPSLVGFGAGAFLAAALLDILPEAIEMVEEPHPVFIAVTAGFVAFFAIERFIMRFLGPRAEHKGHSEHTESLPYLLIAGDTFHNFLDGVVIALAYVANPTLGLTATLAIAAHEIPQEIGDFAVLLKVGWKKWAVVAVNVAQSLVTIPGVFIGYYLGHTIEPMLPYLLAFAAGIFLYIAGSDLIPEIHHRSGHSHFLRAVIPVTLGIIILYFLSSLAHG